MTVDSEEEEDDEERCLVPAMVGEHKLKMELDSRAKITVGQ